MERIIAIRKMDEHSEIDQNIEGVSRMNAWNAEWHKQLKLYAQERESLYKEMQENKPNRQVGNMLSF